MPTYVYRCKSCSFEFEEIQKFSDEALKVCPSCKKDTLVRVIGGSGLVFKGSGFYQTDYKKSGPETKKEAGENKETKPEATEKPKTDSTPETKPTSSSPPTSGGDPGS